MGFILTRSSHSLPSIRDSRVDGDDSRTPPDPRRSCVLPVRQKHPRLHQCIVKAPTATVASRGTVRESSPSSLVGHDEICAQLEYLEQLQFHSSPTRRLFQLIPHRPSHPTSSLGRIQQQTRRSHCRDPCILSRSPGANSTKHGLSHPSNVDNATADPRNERLIRLLPYIRVSASTWRPIASAESLSRRRADSGRSLRLC